MSKHHSAVESRGTQAGTYSRSRQTDTQFRDNVINFTVVPKCRTVNTDCTRHIILGEFNVILQKCKL